MVIKETKNCVNCGKLMNKKDYILWKGFPDRMWEIRKYCSKGCSREFIRKKNELKREKDSKLVFCEHKRDIVKINEIINGEAVGVRSISGGYVPDIIKDGLEYEYELFGVSNSRKFSNKWLRKRFDGKVFKKRILVVGISDELTKLFDEVIIYDKKLLSKIRLKDNSK